MYIDHLFLLYPITLGLWYNLLQIRSDWVPSRSIYYMVVISYKGSTLGASCFGKLLVSH